jgi:hypothetical protein
MLLSATRIASAQLDGSARPYRGLFGGGVQTPGDIHTMSVSVSLEEAFADNVLGETVNVIDTVGTGRQGTFTAGDGALAYGLRLKRVQFAAFAETSAQYYPGARTTLTASYYGNVGASLHLARRTQLFVNQRLWRTPSYLSRLLEGLTPQPERNTVDNAVHEEDAATDYSRDGADRAFTGFDTAVSLSHGITRRGTVTLSGSARNSDVNNQSTLKTYDIHGEFAYGLTKGASLRMGYGYREGTLGAPAARYTSRDIDIGLDYNRALSFSRRTTIGLSFGSALVSTPLGEEIGETSRMQYRVVGDGWINHQMGRSWTLRGQLVRGITFVEGFPTPVASNAFTTTLRGLVNRRVEVGAAATYTKGESAVLLRQNTFDTYTASVRARMALSRSSAGYVEYTHEAYDFSRDMQLLTVMPARRFQRNVLRGGLTLWVPIVGR